MTSIERLINDFVHGLGKASDDPRNPLNAKRLRASESEIGFILGDELLESQQLVPEDARRKSTVILNKTGVSIFVRNNADGVAGNVPSGYTYEIPNNGAVDDSFGGTSHVIADTGALATGYINITQKF